MTPPDILHKATEAMRKSETQYTHAIVPLEWDTIMMMTAEAFAEEMSADPERRLAIVGMLQKAWPRLLQVAKPPMGRAVVRRP